MESLARKKETWCKRETDGTTSQRKSDFYGTVQYMYVPLAKKETDTDGRCLNSATQKIKDDRPPNCFKIQTLTNHIKAQLNTYTLCWSGTGWGNMLNGVLRRCFFYLGVEFVNFLQHIDAGFGQADHHVHLLFGIGTHRLLAIICKSTVQLNPSTWTRCVSLNKNNNSNIHVHVHYYS